MEFVNLNAMDLNCSFQCNDVLMFFFIIVLSKLADYGMDKNEQMSLNFFFVVQ